MNRAIVRASPHARTRRRNEAGLHVSPGELDLPEQLDLISGGAESCRKGPRDRHHRKADLPRGDCIFSGKPRRSGQEELAAGAVTKPGVE